MSVCFSFFFIINVFDLCVLWWDVFLLVMVRNNRFTMAHDHIYGKLGAVP